MLEAFFDGLLFFKVCPSGDCAVGNFLCYFRVIFRFYFTFHASALWQDKTVNSQLW